MELISSSLRPVDEKTASLALSRFLSSRRSAELPESVSASLSALQTSLSVADKPAPHRKTKKARTSAPAAAASGGNDEDA